MQDLSVGTAWLHSFLTDYIPEWAAVTLECLLIGVGLMLLYAVLALFYILSSVRCAPISSAVSARTVLAPGA